MKISNYGYILKGIFFIVLLFSFSFLPLAKGEKITHVSNVTPVSATEPGISADAWPRQFKTEDGSAYTIYQPQIDSWDGFTLNAISAVSIQTNSSATPIYGVIKFSVDTHTDKETRMVAFEDIKINDATFPSIDQSKTSSWLQQLRQHLPTQVPNIALDRLEASLEIANTTAKTFQKTLNNDAPAIIFSTKPALLILVDGSPQWQKIGESSFERIINTKALIVRKENRIFLHLWDGYLESQDLKGPWQKATNLPPELSGIQEQLVASKQVDLLVGQQNPNTKEWPKLNATPVPEVHISTVPTELIISEGEFNWTPISETQLLYVSNTQAHIFKEINNQETYILISGRWFESKTLNGPWAYIPSSKLSSDFKNIPDNSPQENVKASIAGTDQAKQAIIATIIPQTIRIDRKTTKLDPAPAYDNDSPILFPIQGTDLSYAANCATPVIKTKDNSWFACQNAVWFTATSASGPWTVADTIPAAIYSIPVSCPIYYVTYVRVYRYDQDYVWVGYTPGYYGAIVSADGTVVYGTGYSYTAYAGSTVYVSYPVTYGYSCNPCWTPWYGWFFGFAAGWAWANDWYYWACFPPAPYWGPYWPYCYGWGYNDAYGGITAWGPYGWAGTSGNIYHDNGPWHSASRAAEGYDGWTGNQWATQYGHAYNSVTGTRVAGQRGAVENVFTGNYAYGGRGIAHNDNSGITAWGQHGTIGNENNGREISGGHETIYNPNTGNATHIAGAHGNEGNSVVDVNGNIYGGHDGNVYKRNSDGSWTQVNNLKSGQERNTDQSQHQFQRSSDFNHEHFEHQYQSRQLGEQRTNNFRMNHPQFHGFQGFHGGFHGFRR